MRIVFFKGGLGNQMFQYNFALLLNKLTKDTVILDFSYYKVRGLKPSILNFNLSLINNNLVSYSNTYPRFFEKFNLNLKRLINFLFNKKYLFEKDRSFVDYEKIINFNIFDGYWQSLNYINTNGKHNLLNEFSHNDLTKKTYDFINYIEKLNCVFIGVRRGDYLKHKKHYGEMNKSYFINAINYFESKLINPVFFIFSNDILWCKENIINKNGNIFYREHRDIQNDFEELIIMSKFKHAIISNSTFHWWAAYLISNPNKIVISPRKWFFDNKPINILPNDWIKF
jgi:hypothetical protein